MTNKQAYYKLCSAWAKCFEILDVITNICVTKHQNVDEALFNSGIPLTNNVIAEIYELEYFDDKFYVTNYSIDYFSDKRVGETVDYIDISLVEDAYNLIPDYVKENYTCD